MTEEEKTDNHKPLLGEGMNTNDDFELEFSDEDLCDGKEWEPSPNEIIDLFEQIAKETVLELEWKTPGRRPPTPDEKLVSSNIDSNVGEGIKKEEKTDFDFKDEMASLRPSRKSMRPEGTGAILKGSAKKKTTSLDAILSNMARHRKLDMMEDPDYLLP